MKRHLFPVLGLLTMVGLYLVAAGPVFAFARDTHYYLTYLVAMDSCFDWREAHIIASANRRIDGQSATKAEGNITKTYAKTQWHAFGHDEARLRELWYRALDEQDADLQLVYLGQFLHFLQDWESHAGFPTGIGHATATFLGKDPDSWARDESRTEAMIMATGDHVPRFCAALGRTQEWVEDPDHYLIQLRRWVLQEEVVFDAVYAASSPRWKARRMTGGFTKKGKQILEDNSAILEGYIEEYLKPLPGKGIPEEFEAGDSERGLPRALPLRYDRLGSLVNREEALASAGKWTRPDQHHGGNNQVSILEARLKDGSWEVEVGIENTGNQKSRAGKVGLGVYDPLTQEVLGEQMKSLPAIGPDKDLSVRFSVPVSEPDEEVIIIAWIEVDEMEQSDNEAWFIQTDDVEYIETELEELEEERLAEQFEKEDLELFTDPKAWLTDHDELCVIVWAQLDDLDPTRFLEPAEYWLEDASGSRVSLESTTLYNGSDWNMSVLGRNQRPAPKVWACFEIEKDLCAKDEPSIQPKTLRVSVGTDDVRVIDTLDLGPETAREIVAICDQS